MKKRQLTEGRDTEKDSRLEQLVREVMQRHAEEEALRAGEWTKTCFDDDNDEWSQIS